MKIIAGVLVVLALVSAIVPQFADCQSQGRALTLADGRTVPMKCHWTSEASLATAVPLAMLGGLIFFSKRKETQRALAILGAVLGLFLILLPTALIGVCASPDMICNSLMRPTLIFTGILTMVTSGIALVLSLRGEIPVSAGQPA
jgi:hypothetical protein